MIVILDMDGVVTSEEGYWRSAWCSVHELAAALGHAPARDFMRAPRPWALPLDREAIAEAKQRLINTNWDLCHLSALALIHRLVDFSPSNTIKLLAADWQFGASLPTMAWPPDCELDANVLLREALNLVPDSMGFDLIEDLARRVLPEEPLLLQRQGPVWQWLFEAFQVWFNGQNPEQGHGILHQEPLILPPQAIHSALLRIHQKGHTLAIATGRTRAELIPTLTRHALLGFFDPDRIITHDEVYATERSLNPSDFPDLKPPHLSKPHPFPFLKALYPAEPISSFLLPPWPQAAPGTVVVGDTAGDMRGGSLIGARTIAVLTGAGGQAAGPALRKAGANEIIQDLTHLPELL